MDCNTNGAYAGNLTMSANLTISGNITLSSGMTFSGTGSLIMNAAGTVTGNSCASSPAQLQLTGSGAKTLNTNGTTWTQVSPASGEQTITLTSALQCTTLYISNYGNVTFAGAYNITAGTLILSGYSPFTLTFVSGTTVTITTAINIGATISNTTTNTIKASTASSAVTFNYTGTAANCNIDACIFTDIDATGSTIGILDMWKGASAALTRCKNAVFTVTAANATAGATYTNNGQTFTVDATIAGGTTLNCTMQTSLRPQASGTLTKASGTGDNTITFSACTIAGIINRSASDFATASDAGDITVGTTISGFAGTYHEATEAEVQSGVTFGAASALTGTYSGGSGGGLPILGGSVVR
jgi:hypothetical protein